MILGIGVDIVEVVRIARAMKRQSFCARILTPVEIETVQSPARVAGRWAAKEAIAKAFSVAVVLTGRALTWLDVEITNDDSGAPIARVTHPDWDVTALQLHLSISHERGHAVAMAVIEDRG